MIAIASSMTGMIRTPKPRDVEPLICPLVSQCVGISAGSLEYIAALKPNASPTSNQGYHLRIAFSPLGRTGPLEQVVDHVLEYGGVELVDDLLAVALRENESGVAQHGQ